MKIIGTKYFWRQSFHLNYHYWSDRRYCRTNMCSVGMVTGGNNIQSYTRHQFITLTTLQGQESNFQIVTLIIECGVLNSSESLVSILFQQLTSVDHKHSLLYFLCLLAVEDDTVILGLEPLHGVLLGQPMLEANASSLAAPVSHVHTGPAHHHVEVHAVDTDARVVPETML